MFYGIYHRRTGAFVKMVKIALRSETPPKSEQALAFALRDNNYSPILFEAKFLGPTPVVYE